MRTGIRLSLVALAVGMVWTTWTVDDVVHVLRSGIQDGSEDLVSNALGAVCASLAKQTRLPPLAPLRHGDRP